MINLRPVLLITLLLASTGVAGQSPDDSGGRVSPEGPYKSKVRLLEDDNDTTETDAATLLQDTTQTAYGRALVLRQLAQRGIATGDRDSAIRNFEQALALDSLSDLARYQMQVNLGQLYALSDRHAEAVRILDAAILSVTDVDPAVRMSLANSFLQVDQPDKAARQAARAIGESEVATPAEWIEFAVYAFWQAGMPGEAAKWQLQRLNANPDDVVEWTKLAALYQTGGRPAEALATLQSAALSGLLVTDQDWLRLIQMHVEAGTPDIAAQWLRTRIEQRPDAQQWRWLGQVLLQAGDDVAALDAYGQWARLDGSAAAWLETGQLAVSLAQRETAVRALRKASQSNAPGDIRGRALLLLGQTEMERGQIKAARRAFTAAAEYGGVYRAASDWLDYIAQTDLPVASDQASNQSIDSNESVDEIDNVPAEQTKSVTVATKTVPSLRVYAGDISVAATDLTDEAITLVGQLLRTTRRERIEWTGPLHIVVKGNFTDPSGQLELSVAAPIRRVTPSKGQFSSAKLDAFRCAWQRYEGPRDGLQAAWQALYIQTLAAGLQPSQEARQIMLHRGIDGSDSLVELQIGIL
ncbi:MAG: tetratricopeptide repeat protein [Gammaproteobacteria bacterium]|nr:tetratricopeptide repeat protein [Gammaproteobacteria bacterium]